MDCYVKGEGSQLTDVQCVHGRRPPSALGSAAGAICNACPTLGEHEAKRKWLSDGG